MTDKIISALRFLQIPMGENLSIVETIKTTTKFIENSRAEIFSILGLIDTIYAILPYCQGSSKNHKKQVNLASPACRLLFAFCKKLTICTKNDRAKVLIHLNHYLIAPYGICNAILSARQRNDINALSLLSNSVYLIFKTCSKYLKHLELSDSSFNLNQFIHKYIWCLCCNIESKNANNTENKNLPNLKISDNINSENKNLPPLSKYEIHRDSKNISIQYQLTIKILESISTILKFFRINHYIRFLQNIKSFLITTSLKINIYDFKIQKNMILLCRRFFESAIYDLQVNGSNRENSKLMRFSKWIYCEMIKINEIFTIDGKELFNEFITGEKANTIIYDKTINITMEKDSKINSISIEKDSKINSMSIEEDSKINNTPIVINTKSVIKSDDRSGKTGSPSAHHIPILTNELNSHSSFVPYIGSRVVNDSLGKHLLVQYGRLLVKMVRNKPFSNFCQSDYRPQTWDDFLYRRVYSFVHNITLTSSNEEVEVFLSRDFSLLRQFVTIT